MIYKATDFNTQVLLCVCDMPAVSVVSEPYSGDPQPGCVGHAGETVPHWGGGQDVGHRLFRHAETVSRGDSQVWSLLSLLLSPL